ncbi:hypothetical protein PC110_g10081 [Phytophthora cactorum]|uniref:Uncharacterized protein n=1 Tax=Phytophthora cactorum TaxID=29920 RepID=A0A329SD98_9STRA|nr:hypothetical protein PC110_g10081 [Phytophthora cactorum]
MEARGPVGGRPVVPAAIVTRRDATPMDWRSVAAILLLGTDTREDGWRSAEGRALSCEDDTGPSVVRRIVDVSGNKEAGVFRKSDGGLKFKHQRVWSTCYFSP